MKQEWARMAWLLVGLLPAVAALVAGNHWPGASRAFWGMNILCSAIAAVGMLWKAVNSKAAWVFLSVLVACGLFLVNAGITILAGCARMFVN